VIYNFMALCLAYVGGPGAVEVKMHNVVLMPSWAAGTCCLPQLPVNGRFVRYTKQMALQFVLVKPILAVLTLVLYSTGGYTEGDWAPNNGWASLALPQYVPVLEEAHVAAPPGTWKRPVRMRSSCED
jgi:hypothetical protein